jgi:hypothetical protein
MQGSADFIIDIAGAKLRSQLASAYAMNFFALRRALYAQSASGSHGQ